MHLVVKAQDFHGGSGLGLLFNTSKIYHHGSRGPPGKVKTCSKLKFTPKPQSPLGGFQVAYLDLGAYWG